MKIKREILGHTIEIELTRGELYDAYMEKQEDFDRSDCRNGFELEYSEEAWFIGVFHNDKAMNAILKEMVRVHRRNMDRYDMTYGDSMRDAAHDPEVVKVVDRFKKGN